MSLHRSKAADAAHQTQAVLQGFGGRQDKQEQTPQRQRHNEPSSPMYRYELTCSAGPARPRELTPSRRSRRRRWVHGK